MNAPNEVSGGLNIIQFSLLKCNFVFIITGIKIIWVSCVKLNFGIVDIYPDMNSLIQWWNIDGFKCSALCFNVL